MRNIQDTNKINNAKRQSLSTGRTQFVLETNSRREYFRFNDGKLDEYDLTKLNGHQIRLTDEEKQEMNSFDNFSD